MNNNNEERNHKSCRWREEFTREAGICTDLRRVGKGMVTRSGRPEHHLTATTSVWWQLRR
jgi:hypothetical protein